MACWLGGGGVLCMGARGKDGPRKQLPTFLSTERSQTEAQPTPGSIPQQRGRWGDSLVLLGVSLEPTLSCACPLEHIGYNFPVMKTRGWETSCISHVSVGNSECG